jgi:hypothetical protein
MRHHHAKGLLNRALPWAAGLLLNTATFPAHAHETDQFLMPEADESEFADSGRFFSDWFGQAIRRAVDRANASITSAEAAADRPNRSFGSRRHNALKRLDGARLEADWYRTQRGIASMVRSELPDALSIIDGLEWFPPTPEELGATSDAVVLYKVHSKNGLHTDLHEPLDIRKVGRLWRSGTMLAYGTFLGTDKIGHFVDMGYRYFKVYNDGIRQGENADRAMAKAVRYGKDDPFLGENHILGRYSSGAYSNADMASNYVGMLFYVNLTEPVMLKGERRPPMLELVDGRWRVAAWVAEDPDFFRWFISDHYNEALNPSDFEQAMCPKVREVVAQRRDQVRLWYVDESGQRRTNQWFAQTLRDLGTYHGADYGHTQNYNQLIGLYDSADDYGKINLLTITDPARSSAP